MSLSIRSHFLQARGILGFGSIASWAIGDFNSNYAAFGKPSLMTIHMIKLERAVWTYNDAAPLGKPGGFGAVFEGSNEQGLQIAVKRLHLDAAGAAHRELGMAANLMGQLVHVLPVLDAGKDADSDNYFIVMPKAEGNLQDHLAAKGPLLEAEAVTILAEIAGGLTETSNITHRDLKPANVLRHAGVWKIADFGIARFVEETTSMRTLRDCLSPPYAAPEQWRFERASGATDIYALGCIAFALLTGQPPFSGPEISDFSEQHLSLPPPLIPTISARLQSLVLSMLKKEATLRPSLQRVQEQLGTVSRPLPDSAAAQALASSSAAISSANAIENAKRAAAAETKMRRDRVAQEARNELDQIAKSLFDQITHHAPETERDDERSGQKVVCYRAELSDGKLRMQPSIPFGTVNLEQCGWDVLASGAILVETARGYKRSASLWFTNQGNGEEYRWVELGFMVIFGDPPDRQHVPFHLEPGRDADLAIGPVVHRYQLGCPTRPIDGEDQFAFFERWMGLFSQAVSGTLIRPTTLPLSD